MDNNFTQHILLPSLNLIRTDSKIKRFYFFPGLLSVIFLSVLLVYQVVYTYVVLLGNQDALFGVLLQVFHSNYITEILIGSGIFVFFYIILIPIFEGGLIRYIKEKENGDASRSDSLGFGIFHFYTLFEFHNIFNMFKLSSIINGFLFSLRFIGLEYLHALALIFFIAFLFSLIVNILIAYARYEIILENKSVFEAIGVSSQISLLNIKTTLRLFFFMFIMNIRVVINFIIFLVFPLFGAFLAGVISSQIFTTIAFFILGGIFIFLLLVLGYLASVLDIFTTAIWYHAYAQGKEKLNTLQKNDH